MNSKKKWHRAQPHVIVSYILVIIFILSAVLPVVFTFMTSLKSNKEFFNNIYGLPQQITWTNYAVAWKEGSIGTYFGTSITVVGITVVITTILGALAGYALAKMRIPHADFIILALLGLNMLPSESVVMPLYIMLAKLGMTGKLISLILPYISWGLPMTIYIFRNFFATIPGELLEAARIDGCSELAAFRKVIMPLMLPPVATTAILNFVGWWGELLWASIVLSASTVKTIPLGILAFQGQFSTNWGALTAATCIVLIPMILFFAIAQKYFIKGLTEGAVKG